MSVVYVVWRLVEATEGVVHPEVKVAQAFLVSLFLEVWLVISKMSHYQYFHKPPKG